MPYKFNPFIKNLDRVDTSGGVSSSLVLFTTSSTINDVNTSFVFSGVPTVVVVNGTAYRNGHGCTISGVNVTLDNPVGTGGDIYGMGSVTTETNYLVTEIGDILVTETGDILNWI